MWWRVGIVVVDGCRGGMVGRRFRGGRSTASRQYLLMMSFCDSARFQALGGVWCPGIHHTSTIPASIHPPLTQRLAQHSPALRRRPHPKASFTMAGMINRKWRSSFLGPRDALGAPAAAEIVATHHEIDPETELVGSPLTPLPPHPLAARAHAATGVCFTIIAS